MIHEASFGQYSVKVMSVKTEEGAIFIKLKPGGSKTLSSIGLFLIPKVLGNEELQGWIWQRGCRGSRKWRLATFQTWRGLKEVCCYMWFVGDTPFHADYISGKKNVCFKETNKQLNTIFTLTCIGRRGNDSELPVTSNIKQCFNIPWKPLSHTGKYFPSPDRVEWDCHGWNKN